MKENWTYKKLGEICEVLDSKRKPITKSDRQSGDIPYYGATGIQDYVKDFIFDGRYLLVGEDGAKWGKDDKTAYIIEGKSWVNNHAHVLKIHEDVIDLFVTYYLNGKDLNSYVTGAVVPKLTQAALVSIPIPIPPLETQSRIVSELDLLQSIIEKQQAQLKELDTLAQAIFYDMFGDPVENEKGWEVKTLKDSVTEMFLGPFGSALKTDCYVDKDSSFCMIYEQKHAIKKTMDVDTHFIDKAKYESLKRFEVHAGDFIMSCRGTIGEIYRIPNDAPIGIIHPSLMKIRIREDVYHPTFFLWLLSRIIKNENTNGNCVQMAITAKELGTRKPICPPLPLQQSFATKIEAIEKQKAAISQSIAETQKLFDSRMDYYFG